MDGRFHNTLGLAQQHEMFASMYVTSSALKMGRWNNKHHKDCHTRLNQEHIWKEKKIIVLTMLLWKYCLMCPLCFNFIGRLCPCFVTLSTFMLSMDLQLGYRFFLCPNQKTQGDLATLFVSAFYCMFLIQPRHCRMCSTCSPRHWYRQLEEKEHDNSQTEPQLVHSP